MASHTADGSNRRDFIVIAAQAFAGVGVGIALWPFIQQMNPDASTQALASTEVDLSGDTARFVEPFSMTARKKRRSSQSSFMGCTFAA